MSAQPQAGGSPGPPSQSQASVPPSPSWNPPHEEDQLFCPFSGPGVGTNPKALPLMGLEPQ